MFDHITFQTDKDPLPFIAAIADRNNSGAEVPAAIIVSQINNADTLKYFAILTLEFIRWLAANQSKNNQTANKINAQIIIKSSNKK